MTVHSLTSTAAATPFSRRSNCKNYNISTPQFQRVWASSSSHNHHHPPKFPSIIIPCARRSVTLGLTAALLELGVEINLELGVEINGGAMAAARRPPPPPPTEKKDPNVSGTLAKVLASKKRKEEMKEAMAKLREKGKPIN